MQITDILDGFLARKLNAVSHFGRKLDAYGDYILQIVLLISLTIFLKNYLYDNLLLIVIILLSYIIPAIYILIKKHTIPQLHLNTHRFVWGVVALFIILTVFNIYYYPLFITITFLFVLAGIDRFIFYVVYDTEDDLYYLDSLSLLKSKQYINV